MPDRPGADCYVAFQAAGQSRTQLPVQGILSEVEDDSVQGLGFRVSADRVAKLMSKVHGPFCLPHGHPNVSSNAVSARVLCLCCNSWTRSQV